MTDELKPLSSKLEALLPNGFAQWAAAAGKWRNAVKASGLSFSGRRKFWQVFTAHAVKNPEVAPLESDFDRFVADVKGLGVAVDTGRTRRHHRAPQQRIASLGVRLGDFHRGAAPGGEPLSRERLSGRRLWARRRRAPGAVRG